MKQSKQNLAGTLSNQLWLWEGSREEENHANHTALPVKDLEKKMQDTYGRKCVASLKKFNQIGFWAKTFTALLIGMEGWYSTKCRLTWKLRGTKCGRMYCQLVPSELPTGGTGSRLSLLKTPTKMDGEVTSGKANPVSGNSGTLAQEIMSEYKPTMEKLGLLPTVQARDWNGKSGGHQKGKDLPSIANKMLPTPTAMDSNGATANMKSTQVKEGSMHSMTFSRYVMLPTPATRDYKGARSTEALEEAGRTETNSLPDFFHQPGKTSQLSVLFVEEMMGYPLDYLVLPFQNGEPKE